MKVFKLLMATLGLVALLLVSTSCGNEPAPEQRVECTKDADCNKNDKCRVCSSDKCVKKSDCCTTDLECTGGERCWNVPGKAYGKCGAAK